MARISFVIPVYNGDAYLAETIETIRRQTMKDIEIIVIDDCSPDYTEDLMDYYIKLDGRIKYHRFEMNEGVEQARNYGNKMAESELICVSDQDDLSTFHRAEYSYQFFKFHPEYDCLTSAYYECNVDGMRLKKYTPMDMTREIFEQGGFVWFHSSACYRKKDILELPYRTIDGQTDDWTFLEDWTKAGKKFKSYKKVLADCRRTPWSVMQQRRFLQGVQPSYYL